MTTKILTAFLGICVGLCASARAQSPYSPAAGKNEITQTVDEVVKLGDGRIEHHKVERRVASDTWGNAAGSQNDLAVDGAFEGQTVAVLHLYTGEGFDFSLPKAALKEKGFSVYRWVNAPPPADELRKALKKACQLWIISGPSQQLTDAHLKVIKEYFDAGHGVYVWGDNEPFYADANAVSRTLFGTTMLGNVPGDQTVGLQAQKGKHGLLPNHLLSTGLEHVYEGITIATIQPNQVLTPLIYGSADNLVAGFYEKNGKRAIVDGGFTRLYYKWDTAGTGRYVKNAAAWLVNFERFGKSVISANP
jgi:hypothetical protein